MIDIDTLLSYTVKGRLLSLKYWQALWLSIKQWRHNYLAFDMFKMLLPWRRCLYSAAVSWASTAQFISQLPVKCNASVCTIEHTALYVTDPRVTLPTCFTDNNVWWKCVGTRFAVSSLFMFSCGNAKTYMGVCICYNFLSCVYCTAKNENF